MIRDICTLSERTFLIAWRYLRNANADQRLTAQDRETNPRQATTRFKISEILTQNND